VGSRSARWQSRHFATVTLPGCTNTEALWFAPGHCGDLVADCGTRLWIVRFDESRRKEDGRDTERSDHATLVRRALREIQQGNLDKVVISRRRTVSTPADFDVDPVVAQLGVRYKESFRYAFRSLDDDEQLWIGATPELLLRKRGSRFTSVALAGTVEIGQESRWTAKERLEQQYVIDDIRARLDIVGAKHVLVAPTATVLHGRVAHLRSTIDFTFDGDGRQVVDALHPTAACAGLPRDRALDFIRRYETFDRGFYSGYALVERPNGDFDAYVLLRCMTVHGDRISFYAGGGITEGSLPELEWRETELKMRTMSSVIDAVSRADVGEWSADYQPSAPASCSRVSVRAS
jgi:isochorismate synthase